MDEDPTTHGHLVSMDLPEGTARKSAMIMSGALGLVVAVITFGICGFIQRDTFKNTTVTFEDATSVTVIEEEK